jgi:hypothetical protein
MRGKQYRKKTGARSWAGAEEAKKVLEAQLTGGTFCPLPPRPMGRLLCETIETFKANKQTDGGDLFEIWVQDFDPAPLYCTFCCR